MAVSLKKSGTRHNHFIPGRLSYGNSFTDMNQCASPFRVGVYSDSRGSWLAHELRNYNNEFINYSVHYRKGSGLIGVWEMLEADILNNETDFAFIYASICDLTEKFYSTQGRRYVLPPYDLDVKFRDVESIMKGIVHNTRLLTNRVKICFIQETGIDLVRYNRFPHPVPATILIAQISMDHNIRKLQNFTKKLNDDNSVPTLWSLEITHSFKHNIWQPVYDRTFDGLHLSHKQVVDLAKSINNYVTKTIYRHL